MSGIVAHGRIELYVPSERQHLWSPQLIVEVHDAPGDHGGSLLLGRFGPHPHVWALYLAMAGVTTFAALVAVSFAYAQWVMGQAPFTLLALPLALVAWGALYLVALQGQRWGAEQVAELRAFLEDGLNSTERDPTSLKPDGVFMRAPVQTLQQA
jgi:hypothetical protein